MSKMFWLARGLCYIPSNVLFPAKIVNKNNIPKKQAYLSVTNHLQWTDTVHLLFEVPGHRRIIAKKEIGQNWFIKIVKNWIGLIFVDRGNTDMKTLKTILGSLKSGKPVAIYPEGTRNKNNRGLQEVKSGASVFAIKSDVPVVPMLVYERSRLFRKNYMYVGESLDLSQYKGVKLTAEVIAEADNLIRQHMLKTMVLMDDYVENKRWKKKNRLNENGREELLKRTPLMTKSAEYIGNSNVMSGIIHQNAEENSVESIGIDAVKDTVEETAKEDNVKVEVVSDDNCANGGNADSIQDN